MVTACGAHWNSPSWPLFHWNLSQFTASWIHQGGPESLASNTVTATHWNTTPLFFILLSGPLFYLPWTTSLELCMEVATWISVVAMGGAGDVAPISSDPLDRFPQFLECFVGPLKTILSTPWSPETVRSFPHHCQDHFWWPFWICSGCVPPPLHLILDLIERSWWLLSITPTRVSPRQLIFKTFAFFVKGYTPCYFHFLLQQDALVNYKHCMYIYINAIYSFYGKLSMLLQHKDALLLHKYIYFLNNCIYTVY